MKNLETPVKTGRVGRYVLQLIQNLLLNNTFKTYRNLKIVFTGPWNCPNVAKLHLGTGSLFAGYSLLCHSQTLRDSRCSSLCLAHGRFKDPSNLVFKLIIAVI